MPRQFEDIWVTPYPNSAPLILPDGYWEGLVTCDDMSTGTVNAPPARRAPTVLRSRAFLTVLGGCALYRRSGIDGGGLVCSYSGLGRYGSPATVTLGVGGPAAFPHRPLAVLRYLPARAPMLAAGRGWHSPAFNCTQLGSTTACIDPFTGYGFRMAARRIVLVSPPA